MKSVEIKSQSGEFHKKKYRAPVTGWGGLWMPVTAGYIIFGPVCPELKVKTL